MSEFAVPILQLDDVVPHPNADRLDLAVVGGYRSVVPRGKFKTGDWVVYIPEGAVIPEWILEKEGLTGYLAGPNKDRVRAVKLRGELSQGIVMRASDYNGGNEPSIAADDISDALGIVKYEPPLPRQFAGRFAGAVRPDRGAHPPPGRGERRQGGGGDRGDRRFRRLLAGLRGR